MNKNLELQKLKLQYALQLAEKIQMCDHNIEVRIHPDYFKAIRTEAIQLYAEAVMDLMESFIEISASFQKPVVTAEEFLQEINTITDDYRKHNLGINIL